MKNLPTLTQIASDPSVLARLPLDALDALLSDAAAEATVAAAARKAILAYIEASYAGDIAHAYDIEAKDFGTVHVFDAGFDIEVNAPKKAEWDQEKLREVGDKIAADGDDPHEYLDVFYSVSERKFTAWPAYLQHQFEAARTLKPGTRTLKLSRAKREAA